MILRAALPPLLCISLLAGLPQAGAGVFDGGISERPAPSAGPPVTVDEPSGPVCLRFASTARGPALVNLCGRCRRAAIAQSAAGGRVATTRFLVAPRSALPLTGPKSGTLRIVEDRPCR